MKTSQWGVMVLVVGLVIGFAMGATVQGQNANAQGAPGAAVLGRFQIAPIADENRDICFVIDTATGAMWKVISVENQPGISKVVERLP